jgi:hypothetical protein
MKVSIMQPYFFPYIGYFQLIHAADKFIILDDVNYINRGWINRNRMLMNGKDFLFTVPLNAASQNRLINEIEILSGNEFKSKTIKSFESSYKKAPFFNDVFPLLIEVFSSEEKLISKLALSSILSVCSYLNIKTMLIETSTVYLNHHLKGQERIIDICIRNRASVYLNPQGGTELYDKKNFSKNNIELKFLTPGKIQYHQFKNDFIPWLSIIDVLMFNSKDEVKNMLNHYTLN